MNGFHNMNGFLLCKKRAYIEEYRAKSWRDPGSLWHCLRLCIQPWLKHTHGLFSCIRKDKIFSFKSVGLIFCHLNKKVHNQKKKVQNQYDILPMDPQMAPHAKGPFFQDFQELPFNEQTLTLRRTRWQLECGRLLWSWALALGQRANGFLASRAPLLKLPGEFCFINFPASWYPSGLVIRSLNGSLLDGKKNVWSQLQRAAVGGNGSVLPNSYAHWRKLLPPPCIANDFYLHSQRKYIWSESFELDPFFTRIYKW